MNDDIIDQFKKMGNISFSHQNYGEAARTYSNALQFDPSNTNLLSNRAAAYLHMGLYKKALSDAETVLLSSPRHEKCLHRKVKALWGLRRYDEALKFIQKEDVKSPTISKAIDMVKQSRGHYDIVELYNLARDERHEVAEYTGPVEIKPVQGKGRGLIATKDISMGTLILCSKAFSIAFDKDVQRFKEHNDIDAATEWSADDTCGGIIREKTEMDEDLKSEVYDLYSFMAPGDDISMKVNNITKYNGFRGETNTTITGDGKSVNFCGLWILPSYMNHSCIDSNAIFDVIGDIFMLRALRQIKQGEEITISYWAPTVPIRRKVMTARKFNCDCRSCNMEREEEGTQIPGQISNILDKIRQDLRAKKFEKCFQGVKKMVELRAGKEDLNVALLCEEMLVLLNVLRERKELKKVIFILEKMHAVCKGNVLLPSAVHQSKNLCGCYMELEEFGAVRKWWGLFKEDMIAMYGSVKDGIKIMEIESEEVELYERIDAENF